MEPISAIAISLALGAGATAGKEVVGAVVKDAYSKLKELVRSRYPKVSVDHLEQAPESKARRVIVEEELTAAGAGQDAELVVAAQKLIELIQQHAPDAAAAIGVDLKDVSAANLRLADIAAAGTGGKVERGTFTGDIEIKGVRAGTPGGIIISGGTVGGDIVGRDIIIAGVGNVIGRDNAEYRVWYGTNRRSKLTLGLVETAAHANRRPIEVARDGTIHS
jgi:hypothetical protein